MGQWPLRHYVVVHHKCADLPAFFLANRLLPLDMAQRAQWEIHCFFLLGGAWLHAICRPAALAWRQQWMCAAILWWVLPAADRWSTDRAPLSGLRSMDTLFISFDVAFLGAGLVCYCLATKAGLQPRDQMPLNQL